MIKIKSPKRNWGINFPVSLNEITPEMLGAMTAAVKLPKYYCVVALAFKTKVFDFCAMLGSPKSDRNIGVTPLLAKISDEDSATANAVVGDRVVVTRSALEMGVQLKLPVSISSDHASKYFLSDREYLRTLIQNGGELEQAKNMNQTLVHAKSPEIIVLEFKILPINAISAAMPLDAPVQDPFMASEGELN